MDLKEIQSIQQLLFSMPRATDSQPEILKDPGSERLENLFNTNPVIALDVEYSIANNLYKRKLAYIQCLFLQSNTIAILTYDNQFQGFPNTFFKWLEGQVVILGFSMMTDLALLWIQFKEYAPDEHVLLYKVFDFFCFLKFIYNGGDKKYSLEYWANKLLNWQLNKT